MKLRYVNGEKVYVDGLCGITSTCLEAGKIEVLKHNELIRALNAMFLQAEENPDEVTSDLSHIIWQLSVTSKKESHKPKSETFDVEILKKAGFKFDGIAKVKRSKQLMLQQEKRVEIYNGPKVIKGGIYKPSERPAYLADDMLSDEFKAWRKAQNQEVPT